MSARLSAAIAAALAGVICLQTGPFLPLFFAVPLFTVLFLSGRAVFAFSALLLVLFDAIATAVHLFATGVIPSFSSLISTVSGSVLLLAPLMCLLLPSFIRYRYRITFAGVVSALLWVAVSIFTDSGESFNQLLVALAVRVSETLKASLPADVDPGFLAQAFTSEGLYKIMRSIILYSLVSMPVVLYAFSWRLGFIVANFFRKGVPLRYPVSSFYNERIMLYALSTGMLGIIVHRYFANEILSVVSWNVLLASSFWFVLQGAGIFSFFLKRIAMRKKGLLFWLGLFVLVLSAIYGGPFMIIALLIVGVVEQFVPMRRRFDDKDIVDPTPGRGNDQNQ